MNKCEYIVDENGIIFRKYKTITKEVPKRLGSRGYLEFKMNNKSVSYKRFVAQKLIPNPNNCDKVFSKNGDQFDTRPENLKWVWTRERRTLTASEALQKCTDDCLKDYYLTFDKKALRRKINNIFEHKIYCNDKNNFIGDLYLLIDNYLERNLLFNLKDDIIIALWGLKKQRLRKQILTTQLNEKYF